jgi:hypothetical protein
MRDRDISERLSNSAPNALWQSNLILLLSSLGLMEKEETARED